MQVVASRASARTTEVVDLERKLDMAGDDIALINRRLDESQGMYFGGSLYALAYDISGT